MSVDLATNLNINKAFGNSEADGTAATAKTTAPSISNGTGITNISDTKEELLAPFITPKSSLRTPETNTTVENLASQTVKIDPEIAKTLSLGEQTTLGEFISACTGKIKDDLGKAAGDDKVKAMGGTPAALDNDTLDCLVALLTMGTKSNLIETLRGTLQDKVKQRAAQNQDYIDKTVETSQKSVEAQKKQEAAAKKAKFWGIFGAVLSAIAAVVTTVLTAVTFGAAAPLAIVAYAACAATVAGSVCTIIGTATGNATLSKVGMWLGVAGAVLSLGGGVAGVFVGAAAAASTALRFAALAAGFVSGIVNGGSQIANGVNQMELAKLEKELSEMKIDLEKLDQDISVLSDFIEKVSEYIQQFMKDLLNDEEEAGQLLQQTAATALNIEQNVKC